MSNRVVVETASGPVVKDVRWTKAFPLLWTILLEWKLTPVECRVLVYLVSCAKMRTNVVNETRQARIAAALGHDRSSVGRALRHLTTIGVIRRGEWQGHPVFVINPHVTFRANSDARGLAVKDGTWYPPINTRK